MFRYLLIFLLCFITSAPALAQQSFPRVHLVAHSSVEDRIFLEELKCMLENVFMVEVVLHREAHQLDISGAYKSLRRQYNAGELLKTLADQKKSGFLPEDGYIFYMVEPDIYRGSYNFLFALMDFKTNINVMSLARLRHKDDGHTTDRMFRLVAKNIAKFSGHRPSGKCFMGFSNSLGELDSRIVRLCEPDLSALQSMGLVKPELKDGTIMKGCALIM